MILFQTPQVRLKENKSRNRSERVCSPSTSGEAPSNRPKSTSSSVTSSAPRSSLSRPSAPSAKSSSGTQQKPRHGRSASSSFSSLSYESLHVFFIHHRGLNKQGYQCRRECHISLHRHHGGFKSLLCPPHSSLCRLCVCQSATRPFTKNASTKSSPNAPGQPSTARKRW